MNKITIQDLDCQGKRVLMRVDFNVPIRDGKITNDARIQASLPSIRKILDQGAKLILMSHLGRPKIGSAEECSLSPCARRLGELLKIEVKMAPDCVGCEVRKMVDALNPGEILLLENLRLHEAEKNPEKDPGFAKELASFGDFYVNDAFATCHREHSSVGPITQYFVGKAAAGLLVEKEVQKLSELLGGPKRPFIAMIGGAKISTKIGVLDALIKKVDVLMVGGAMACTFLRAEGYSMGDSLVEEGQIPAANRVIKKCIESGVKLLLPIDLVIAKQLDESTKTHLISLAREGVQKGWKTVDIGPGTIEQFSEALQEAKTIFWNGPMGVFEVPPFAKGTFALAKLLAKSEASTVVGGGDSVSAIEQLGLGGQITHLSTGGGAALKFVENGTLPAIELLSERDIAKKRP